MANEGIELEVYKYSDYTTKAGLLTGRIEPEFLEELTGGMGNGGNGGGSFTIPIDDPDVVQDPELIAERNLVKFKTNGQVTGAFILQGKATELVNADEYEGRVYSVSGESVRTLLSDARVKPFGGFRANSMNQRAFNFASEQGDWYDAGDWGTPWIVPQPYHVNWTENQDWPTDILGNSALWVWGQSFTPPAAAGNCYFRFEFTTAVNKSYSLYLLADDAFVAYIDGQQIGSSDITGTAYTNTTKIDLGILPPGQHVLAFKVMQLHGGPAGLKAALLDTTGGSNIVTTYTGAAGWKTMAYPAEAPTWSIGEVLLTLLDEAADRGVRFASLFTPTFSSTQDSNGNPWGQGYEWVFGVGETTYLDVVKTLEAYCYIWIDPDTFELHAALERGSDLTELITGPSPVTPVVFSIGHNLAKASIQTKDELVNDIDYKTSDAGWKSGTDPLSTSKAKYGTVEGYIDTGMNQVDSGHLITNLLAKKSDPEQGSTYQLIPSGDGDVPNVDFFVGDWVLAPDENNTPTPRRVVSLSTMEGENGEPDYTIEFDTIWQEDGYVMEQVLSSMGGSTLAPGLTPAGGGGSSNVGVPVVVNPGVAIILPPDPIDPAKVTGLSVIGVPYWPADGIEPRVEVTITWSAVLLDVEGNSITPLYYDVWYKPTTSAGGDRVARTSGLVAELPNFLLTDEGEFTVQAVLHNEYGYGEFSDPVAYSTATTPSAMPAPLVTAGGTSSKGMLNIPWSGLMAGSSTPPPQFRHAYIEVKTASGGSWARHGTVFFRGGGTIPVANLTVGDSYIWRLTGVDGLGVETAKSADSAPVTIVGVDIPDLATAVTDAISDAAGDAATALATANGKNTVYSQPNEPTGGTYKINDLWFDTDAGYLKYTWSGSAWVPNPLGPDSLDVGAITAGKIAVGALNGLTITGAIIQTADADVSGIKLTGNVFVAYDTAGEATFLIDGETGTLYFADGIISGDALVNGTINATKIDVGSLVTALISSPLGEQLNLESNESVNIIVTGAVAGVQAEIEGVETNLAEMQTYYQFGPAGATISSPGSPFAIQITNSQINMLANGNIVSYWNAGNMVVPSLVADSTAIIGAHQWRKEGTRTTVRAL